jgi:electron transfer flavoprotein alpha/beta subunit
MNVVVCLKQVPGTTEVRINPETNTLIRQGIKNIINPFDCYALEEGVRWKEKLGGKVTVVSMGPPQAVEMLKEAISLGADEALLLCDGAFAGADTWSTDGDTGQVGPEMAAMLGMPFLAYVSQIEEMTPGQIKVKRMVDDGHEIIESPLPAVITVTKEINIPRLPSLRGIMKSRSTKIPTWTISNLGVDPGKVGLSGSFTRVVRIFTPRRDHKAEMIEGGSEQKVTCLIGKLKEARLI